MAKNRVDTDILIVGAGPTGLTLACELARHNVAFRIVDRSNGPSQRRRVMLLTSRTMEVLNDLELRPAAVQQGIVLQGCTVYQDNQQVAYTSYNGTDGSQSVVLSQSALEQILLYHLESFGQQVEWNTEVTTVVQNASQVLARLRRADRTNERIHTTYLIGCDGAQSTVRNQLKQSIALDCATKKWVHGIARFENDLPEDELISIASNRGRLLATPKAQGTHEIWAELPRFTEGSQEFTLTTLRRIVDAHTACIGKLSHVEQLDYHQVEYGEVKQLRVGRIFLAGEAAHSDPLPPLTSNLGMQDACNLGWKLAMTVHDMTYRSILCSYQQERHGVVMGQKAELQTDFSPSASYVDGPQAGDQAPSCPIKDALGKKHCLHTLLGRGKYTALLFTNRNPSPSNVHAEFEKIWHHLNSYYSDLINVHLVLSHDLPDILTAWTGSILLDRDGSAHKQYGAKTASIYLIRPDGQIAFRSLPPNFDYLTNYLETTFSWQPAGVGTINDRVIS